MKTCDFMAVAVGLVPWFLVSADLRAEEPKPAPERVASPAEKPPSASSPRPLINVQFPGGTVADYVEAVLKTTKDINIVVMPEAREFELPPLQLSSVDVGSAMELLHGRTERRGKGIMELEVHEIEPFQGNGRPIFNVSSNVGPAEAERPDEAGVWTISELLSADLKAQDVLTAIQTAVELISEQYGPAEIRFHEATGLVIARGHDRQMDAVEQVIKRLREGLERTRKGSPTSNPLSQNSPATSDVYKQQVQALSDRLAKAEQRVSQLEQEKAVLEARATGVAEFMKESGTKPK